MQVIKTKKGVFYREKIYVDGKAKHSPRFSRKTDAVAWKARFSNEKGKYLSTGIKPEILQEKEDQSLIFSDYALMWLETRVKLQLSYRTYEHYAHTLKKHLLPRFGQILLKDIKLRHADRLILELAKRGHNARGINLIVAIMKRVLLEAVREERLDRSPLQYLKELKEPPRPDVFLSAEEIEKILDVSKGHYFHTLFILAANTGMRRGELAGLCWDKISFDRSLIEISRLRDRLGLGDRTKTAGSRRYIPMNAVVRNYLLVLKENSTQDIVVIDENGEPFDVDHLYRDFRKFLKLAGITKHYRFHDLRHTFASHFMMNGGNIYDLQKILGHTSLEMTQRYAHLAPEHLVQAANVVSFGQKEVPKNLKLIKNSNLLIKEK